MNIIRYFATRNVLVNVIMIFIVLLGIISIYYMKLENFPNVDLGIINITTARPGSSPQDMEVSITVPLEEEILKVGDLAKVTSYSMEEISVITIRTKSDVKNKEKLINDIQKAVDRATARLPKDIPQKPLFEEMSTGKIPIMQVHISGNVPEDVLRSTAKHLANGLREVKGVSGVEKVGFRDKEVKIFLDPSKLEHFRIHYNEIIEAVNRRNVRDSGGSMDSFITEKKVLTIGQFQNPKDVKDVIIRTNGLGNNIRIREIAEVILDYEDWKIQNIADNLVGITLLPKKQENTDAVKTSTAIKKYLQNVDIPPGVKLTIVNDMSRFTLEMIEVLSSNALLGFVLVFITLLIFFEFKLAFWVSIGVPVVILFTFTLMPLFGLGINLLTLIALILVMGMLVDDAIVTGESIYRCKEEGMTAVEASVEGTKLIAAPVFVSSLTTILAFTPLVFMGGMEGKFFLSLPIMIAVTLGASLFECFFMLPAHLAHIKKKSYETRLWFRHIEKAFVSIMHRCLRFRYVTILVFILGFLMIIWISIYTSTFHLYPEIDIDTFYLKVEIPEGTSFSTTTEKLRDLEKIVRNSIPSEDLNNIIITTGHHDTDFYGATEGQNASWGLIAVYMPAQGKRKTNSNDIIATLRKKTRKLSGYSSIIVEPLKDTPTQGKPLELEIISNDNESRFVLEKLLLQHIQNIKGVTEAYSSYRTGKDVIKLILDYDLMAHRKITVADVTQSVRIALDGQVINELQTVEEKIEYRLQFRREDQKKLETLRNLNIINREQQSIPLRSFSEFELEPGESSIKHYFGQRNTTIFVDIDRNLITIENLQNQIATFVGEQNLLLRFPNTRIWYGGELEQQQEALGNIEMAFTICFFSIFFILILLFNSLTQPFLIVAVIPFSVGGVILGFSLQGLPLSMVALIGILGLIGVLVNDSLVMISGLNLAKKKAGNFLSTPQIAKIAGTRLRPIIITSLTSVAGFFPAAYGIAGSNPFVTPMIMAMAWGILFGTVISLVLLPCLYTVEQDFRKVSQFVWQKIFG